MFNKFAQETLSLTFNSILYKPRVIIYCLLQDTVRLIVLFLVMRYKNLVNFDPLLHKMIRLGMMEARVARRIT